MPLLGGHFVASLAAAGWDGVGAAGDLPWFAGGWATLLAAMLVPRWFAAACVGVFASAFLALAVTGVPFVTALALAAVAAAEVGVGIRVLVHARSTSSGRTAIDWLRRVIAVGFLIPAAGSLVATAILGDGLRPPAEIFIDRWTSEATGALVLITLIECLDRFVGSDVDFSCIAEIFLGSLASIGLVVISRAGLKEMMPLAVLPLVVVGARRTPAGAAAATTLVLAALVVVRRLGLGSEGHVVACTADLTAAVLVAAVPTAFTLLRREIEEERSRTASSERRFREAMEHAPFGMVLLDPEGRCFAANRAACELLGYERSELYGLRPSDLTCDPSDFADRLSLLEAGSNDEYLVERRFRRRDGSPRWCSVAVSTVREGPDQRPSYLIAQMMDIEERRHAEKALEESENRWNFALESAGQGVWDYDFERGEVYHSRVWSHMLGYGQDEISSRPDAWLELVHLNDLPHLVREERRHLAGETEQFECEFRMRHKDGDWVWILDRGKVIARDATGRPRRMVGTHTDITAFRRLTEAFQMEKERLRITLQSIGDGVVCTDERGDVSFINPVAEGMTGWSAKLALGRSVSAVFRVEHEADPDIVAQDPVAIALATRERVSVKDGLVLIARNGARTDIEATASPVSKPTGELLGAVLVFQDVTRARTLQKELARLASHDALTGLHNRSAFEQNLAEHCREVAEGGRHSLCFVDLDRFKIINDTAGHAAGDALLREIGRLVRDGMRRQDFVARLGGDEFGILLTDCDLDEARTIAERLIEAISRVRFTWDGRVYEVGASVGIARVDAETPLAADLMSRADVACYAAKAAGRNRVSLYNPSESDARRHHRELHTAAGIRVALDEDRFEVYAQEILDLRPSGVLHHHAELLVRMRDDSGAILPPGAFIPAAERYGLMAVIDRWMIRRVLRHLDRMILSVPRLSVSLNLSANSLDDPGLLDFLAAELECSALPPHRLSFEITETSLINNISQAGRLVEELRAAGYAIMLDDFGAGLSSFAYLERFQTDYLKIDGGFVRKLATNPLDRAIVESINGIGHKIGATTIAEFVEDAETLALLREIGVDMVQGYHVAEPEPIAEFVARLGGEVGPASVAV